MDHVFFVIAQGWSQTSTTPAPSSSPPRPSVPFGAAGGGLRGALGPPGGARLGLATELGGPGPDGRDPDRGPVRMGWERRTDGC